MIEPLLEAERAMSFGLIDQAERLYRQVADHDPKSSIAVVGLARVALERGDERTAYVEAKRATEIDPENPAAQHLVMRLTEVYEGRGEPLPTIGSAELAATAPSAAEAAPQAPPPAPAPPEAPAASRAPTRPRKRRSLVDRLLGRSR
jgi:type IV secretory pathway VirB10-like protein